MCRRLGGCGKISMYEHKFDFRKIIFCYARYCFCSKSIKLSIPTVPKCRDGIVLHGGDNFFFKRIGDCAWTISVSEEGANFFV